MSASIGAWRGARGARAGRAGARRLDIDRLGFAIAIGALGAFATLATSAAATASPTTTTAAAALAVLALGVVTRCGTGRGAVDEIATGVLEIVQGEHLGRGEVRLGQAAR